MPLRDILLGALTYPDPTPDRAVRSAVALAGRLGADLTVAAIRADIPSVRNRLAEALIHVDQLVGEEEARSAANADHIAASARIAGAEAGVAVEANVMTAKLYMEGEALCVAARTRDLCLVPVGEAAPSSGDLAEAVLFGSGRPVLVYPEDHEWAPGDNFGVVAVAWDGSARAARAVADAMPILERAREVRVLVVSDEKPQAVPAVADDLIRHLARHGVTAALDVRSAVGRTIGGALVEHVAAHGVELLVMGGFGHARLREFVLGGATAAVLEAPPCPVLMAH